MIEREKFLHVLRTISQLAYVREIDIGGRQTHLLPQMFEDHEVIAWAMYPNGHCSRVWAVRTDIPDGFDYTAFQPHPKRPCIPVSPIIKAQAKSAPPLLPCPSEVVAAEMAMRQHYAIHWQERREARAAKESAKALDDALKLQAASLSVPVPQATPRPSFLSRLFG